jgi:hypothetical protein
MDSFTRPLCQNGGNRPIEARPWNRRILVSADPVSTGQSKDRPGGSLLCHSKLTRHGFIDRTCFSFASMVELLAIRTYSECPVLFAATAAVQYPRSLFQSGHADGSMIFFTFIERKYPLDAKSASFTIVGNAKRSLLFKIQGKNP